jgi:hypothetical protein
MLDTEIVLQPCDPVAGHLDAIGSEVPVHSGQE